MIVKVVPVALVPQVWPMVEQFMENALDYSQGDYTVEHAKVYLTEGLWTLIVSETESGINGAAAVQFFNRPNSRVAFIVAIGGKLCSNHDTYAQMSAIFKNFGATHVEGAARESIARLWRRYGLTEKYRIVGAKL